MEYRHTRISEVVSCLRSCWSDIYEMCRDWKTTDEYLTESECIAADAFYQESDLNRNARRLYSLTADPVLQSEVDMGQYPTKMVLTNLSEVERISDRIDNYFETAYSGKYQPFNKFMVNDIETIRTAIFNIQYVLWPIVDPPKDNVKKIEELVEQPTSENKVDVEQENLSKGEDIAQPDVFIVVEARQPLYEAIAKVVEESERQTLSDLIYKGEFPDSPIKHHFKHLNVFAYLFTQLSDQKAIVGTYSNIARWICDNFTPVTYDTIYDVVRGKNPPTKRSRIIIKL